MKQSANVGDEQSARPVILVRLPANVESDIARLEERLELTLPQFYREFLLNYPPVLFETKTNLRWCNESLADRQLRFSIDELIYYNESVRIPDTPWTEDEGPWPDRYFVIGDDQCGNYWVIDLLSSEESILFYDHDFGNFTVEHSTPEAFADHLIQKTRKWNKEQSSKIRPRQD